MYGKGDEELIGRIIQSDRFANSEENMASRRNICRRNTCARDEKSEGAVRSGDQLSHVKAGAAGKLNKRARLIGATAPGLFLQILLTYSQTPP
ncbi:hypothetical protein TSAR_008694 [Trichomalopsis sarcophagae]|uniref:Uncharacterized protein n=1 Tax=Trichomalopsis sarcophagae TaxID=543379 RepID=A0A232F985_9HYME|nr:hypothetical protein TSAR_008694 [Trichomalopsis sarcophagae]